MAEKRGMKALELWCRRVTEGYPGVKIENMTTSWRDGLAFCALIHHFRPDLIDFDGLDKRDIYKNNELAFRVAERQLGIPALLDAEDMVEYEVPDRLSILTYLSQFYQTFVSNQQASSNSSPRSHSTKVPDMISSSAKSQKTSKVSAGRLESCWSCRRPVFLAERLVLGGKLRHRTCFTCKHCGHQLNPVTYNETNDGDFVCESCPDEGEQRKTNIQNELLKSLKGLCHVNFMKDEYSLDFDYALETNGRNKWDEPKTKFLQDLVDGSQSDKASPGTTMKSDLVSDDVFLIKEFSVKKELPDGADDKQYSIASIKNLHVKIKNLLGRDFSDTLSLLNKESDSFIADISEIIDNIINDAVKTAENHVKESLNNKLGFPKDLKQTDSAVTNMDCKNVLNETCPAKAKENQETDILKSGNLDDSKEEEDYPESLNPFSDDQNEVNEVKKEPKLDEPSANSREFLLPRVISQSTHFNQCGQKLIKAPKMNLNPFWSDGEPSSDEDIPKPTPTPRASLKSSEYLPFFRSEFGSFTSLSSIGSSASPLRRKKGPAPLPPSKPKSSHSYISSPHCRSLSPTPTIRSHRKTKPAPPPPIVKLTEKQSVYEKTEKNHENKIKQNLYSPDKSFYGKGKRKKGQAPGLPIPERRRIIPLPMPEVFREMEDLEIQQRELERQGVTIEQTIRKYESEAKERGEEGEEGGKDVEELILQLFEIVNKKNELFRRQAELMLLRRQERLEEEYADIEYQIRCLMGRPERNKTDSDKAQEEELIRRLVEVVERRSEIIECLDMDRKREVEEDESIHHYLEVFAGKTVLPTERPKPSLKGSSSLLKYIKKKKPKKEKAKEYSVTIQRGADKDVDELNKEKDVKNFKSKKIWFPKT